MFKDIINEEVKLTYKAKQLQIILSEILKSKEKPEKKYRYAPLDITELKFEVIRERTPVYREWFLESLTDSALETGEYNRNSKFVRNIGNIISSNIFEILSSIVFDGLFGAYDKMKDLAGDMGDFIEGVEQAKIELGIDKRTGTAAQRAKFWKDVVWPNDTLYDTTLSMRFQMWGGLAPYWILIENGNYGSSLAYPRFTATYFFYNAVRKIIDDLTSLVEVKRREREKLLKEKEPEVDEKYNKREITLIEESVARFLDNPEIFQPGDVLNVFTNLETQREYEIYVTKTRRIGVHLRR